ncbi:MAG: 30S ribosomal protein S4 [Candidatus Dormibacteria bacterium]
MARETGPVCRLCRREGTKLFLKGTKCYSSCVLEKRNGTPPGQHTTPSRRKVSDYGIQLRAKQRARRLYGVLERQFRIYIDRAERSQGVTGTVLLQELERRLDNVVYRLGFASSRNEARQLVNHRHFAVNGRVVNIASAQVKPGDVVEVREKSRNLLALETGAQVVHQGRSVPEWLSVDTKSYRGTVVRLPERPEMEREINEQLIVEYYSR